MVNADFIRPKVWTAKKHANDNLTGARTHWGLYSERKNVLFMKVCMYGLMIFLGFLVARAYGSIWILILLPAVSLFAIGDSFAWYWDELYVVGRKIQPLPYEARPWRENLHLWPRIVPDMEMRPDTLSEALKNIIDTEEKGETPHSPKVDLFGITFETDPEGYPHWNPARAYPPDGDVIVARIIDDSDKIITQTAQAKGGAIEVQGYGIGQYFGKTYMIQGEPVVMLLGKKDLGRGIVNFLIRKLMNLCPDDLRDKIYDLQGNSRWWRRVYYYPVKPVDPRKAKTSQVDEHMVQENARLRSQIEMLEESVETLQDQYAREIKRTR